MHKLPSHSLFDIIYFLHRCYRKSLKKLLVVLMWLDLCLLPLFVATTLAVDVAIAFAESTCTLGFRSVKNLSLQCNEIHVVGFAFYQSMHGIIYHSGVNCDISFCLTIS
jgi:hypothetical protein